MNKKIIYLIIVLLIISLTFVSVSAEWYSGHLHQHTGYSTDHGYDRDPATWHDDCFPRGLELHNDGQTVEVLSGQAILEGLGWFGLSDHSYCTNTSEFDIVEQDCNTADVPLGFTCLMGEDWRCFL